MKKHISFHELKNWILCPFYHKLKHIEKIEIQENNEYFAYGKAIHSSLENCLKTYETDYQEIFNKFFEQELLELMKEKQVLNEELVQSMSSVGASLTEEALVELRNKFGNYRVVETELQLYEPIEIYDDFYFKGYIDLIIQDENGKYYIIDWKTTSWGWDAHKKNDIWTLYQLVYYKYYFSKKFNIDLNDIECYFVLLKRTANSKKIEFVRITSGKKRIENALKELNKAIFNIINQNYIKNRLNCSSCSLYKKHCNP